MHTILRSGLGAFGLMVGGASYAEVSDVTPDFPLLAVRDWSAKRMSAPDDPLERLAAVVDFEVFRGQLIVALRRSARCKCGRPPLDPVMMFKILVL